MDFLIFTVTIDFQFIIILVHNWFNSSYLKVYFNSRVSNQKEDQFKKLNWSSCNGFELVYKLHCHWGWAFLNQGI